MKVELCRKVHLNEYYCVLWPFYHLLDELSLDEVSPDELPPDELSPDEPLDLSFGGIVSPFKICMSDMFISEEKQPYKWQKHITNCKVEIQHICHMSLC